MRTNWLLTLLLGGAFQVVAADSSPAPGNVPGADHPRISADLTVTVRLRVPDAKVVKLEGGTGLIKEPTAMTRGDDGVWTLTTPPAVPGFHYYWFDVDGVRVNDAGTYSYFGYGREMSGVDVPDPDGGFYAAKPDVPHGAVRIH